MPERSAKEGYDRFASPDFISVEPPPNQDDMDDLCRTIIQSQYIEGVGAVIYRAAEGGGIEGKFKDARNPLRIFQFLIKDGELSYSPIAWSEEEG